VPFYLRTGKRMKERQTRIVVVFRRPPVALFERYSNCEPNSNTLTITLQPDEGFSLRFEVKTPGEGIDVTTQRLNFAYADAFGELREAYETLLLDVIEGDQTLFVHAEEAESSWRLFDPLLEKPRNVKPYQAGSWGPPEAEEMLEMTGTSWAKP
jgi:glucose-6-phosphate 1-dehydrogenase